MTNIAESTASGQPSDPDDHSWGHYGNVQPYHGCGKTFLGSVYTSKNVAGSDVMESRMVWFGQPGSGCVDLAADSVSLAGAAGGSFTFGDRLDVTAAVVNQGSTASEASALGYYLSTDKSLSDGDISFGVTRQIDALDPGANERLATKVRLPETGPVARNYYVLACADDPGEIDEITSANNCVASQRTISVGTAPDLVVASISLGDPQGGSYLSGDAIDVITVIRNRGSAPAPSSFIGCYLSLDQVKDRNDISFGITRSAAALDPGESYDLTAGVNLPTTFKTAKSYYVIACADDKKDIRELDNTNNCRATTGTISVSTVPQFGPPRPGITGGEG